jgi:hypothetical protein
MAQTLTLATTIVQRETGRTAEAVFLPTATLEMLGTTEGPDGEARALGIRTGFRIRGPEQLQDFLFASLVGRVPAWEAGSFDFWHEQRTGRASSPEAVFAEQLATRELVPVSSSPIEGASLQQLLEQGHAWTAVGEWALQHTLGGLAMYFKLAFGVVITRVSWVVGTGLGADLDEWIRHHLTFPPHQPPRGGAARRREPPREPPDED